MNDVGKLAMEKIFSNFEDIPYSKALERIKFLQSIGIEITDHERLEIEKANNLLTNGFVVENKRHRRYAGGDGNLPRNCYFSICENEDGNDLGTLCRELFEYINKKIPGTILLFDSFNKEFVTHFNLDVSEIKKGESCIFVCLIPPSDEIGLNQWKSYYKELLILSVGKVSNEPIVLQLRATHKEQEIDRVIDLRFPETQKWFYQYFSKGDDRTYQKFTEKKIDDFFDMLPTLMYPEYGGSLLTDAVGGWVRLNAIEGLIFPSSRCSVKTKFYDGMLIKSSGWNLVDYRRNTNLDVEMVLDFEPWIEFVQKDAFVIVASDLSPEKGSFEICNIDRIYNYSLKKVIPNGITPAVKPTTMDVDNVFNLFQDVLSNLGITQVQNGNHGFYPISMILLDNGEFKQLKIPGCKSNKDAREKMNELIINYGIELRIVAVGICTSHYLPSIGKFIAITFEHMNVSPVDLILKYEVKNDVEIEFEDKFIVQESKDVFLMVLT